MVVPWLCQWNRAGAEGQVAGAGGGGEQGFALVEDPEGGFDFGAVVAAVHAQQLQQLAQFVAPGCGLPG